MEFNQINKIEEFSTNAIRGKYLEDPPKYNTIVKIRYILVVKYLKLYLKLINLFFNMLWGEI